MRTKEPMTSWMRVAAISCLGLMLSACHDDGSSGTTGHFIRLKNRLETKGDPAEPAINGLGWSVSLSAAYLSVGPQYYHAGAPAVARKSVAGPSFPNAWAWLGERIVGTAHAHPGHYVPGAALGEMLGPLTVDLLSGPIDMAAGEGVTGVASSARFTWQSPPEGKLASRLEGHVVLTKGTATKGERVVRFVATADARDVSDGEGKAQVAGCSFGGAPGEVGVDLDGDGTVTLTVLPSVWFDQVDFAYVPVPNGIDVAADEPVDIAGTMAWEGFVRGIKKGTGYEYSYSKP